MKTCIVVLCILAFNLASFSVQLAQTGAALHVSTAQAAQAASSSAEKVDSGKSRTIAILLAIFPGGHQIYLGNYVTATVYLVLAPFGIGIILSLIDLGALATMTDQEFHQSVHAGESLFGLQMLKRSILGA